MRYKVTYTENKKRRTKVMDLPQLQRFRSRIYYDESSAYINSIKEHETPRTKPRKSKRKGIKAPYQDTSKLTVKGLLNNLKRYDLSVMTVYGTKMVYYYNNGGWSSNAVPFNATKIRKNYKKIGRSGNSDYYRLKANL